MFGPLLEVEMFKKCTPLWREAHFQVKTYKAHHVRTTFGSGNVEKVHAVVARSTFQVNSVKKEGFGPLFDAQMSKKCTPLAREAHFQVKMCKAPHARTTFDASYGFSWQAQGIVHFVKCVQNVKVLSQFQLQLQLQYATLHYATVHYTTLRYTTLQYGTLRYTTLITLHYTTLHYATLHYTTLHYTTLHYTAVHYNALD